MQFARGIAACGSAVLSSVAAAQCAPQWSAYSGPQLDNGVYCVTTWDPDGSGPLPRVLVAGGNFSHVGVSALGFVARWDGTAWNNIGVGTNGSVFVATEISTNWSGPSRLVLGGFFSRSGLTQLNGIGMFDGQSWVSLGSGAGPALSEVWALSQSEDYLVMGGFFDTAGGVPNPGLARWNGVAWAAFADTTSGFPHALVSLGSSLVGGFDYVQGVRRWEDPLWVRVGAAPNDDVWCVTEFLGQIVAAGDFTNLGAHIARFDGTSWQPLGAGINGSVYALCVFDPDGPGPMPDLLVAGGSFSAAGNQSAFNIAAWDGTNWMPLGSGTTGAVQSLTVWNNKLVAGGFFFQAGGLVSPGVAFWGCPEVPVCYANCDLSNASPALNINDFVCFINTFAAGESYANCDLSTAPPVLNVLDFSCFLTKFAGGCT